MKRGGHDRECPLQALARQLREAAPIGKACGVDDGVNASERFARRADESGGRACFGEIARGEGHLGAGAFAFRGYAPQASQARCVAALPVQRQARAVLCQTPRHRGAYS